MDINSFAVPTLRSSPRVADDIRLDDVSDLRPDVGLAERREYIRRRSLDLGFEGGLFAGELDERCQPPREWS